MRISPHLPVIVLVSVPLLLAAQQNPPDPGIEARARAIHDRVLKLDAHVDVLLPATAKQYGKADGSSFADLDKLERGGLNALAMAIAVGPGPRTDEAVAQARREADDKLAAIRTW